MLERNTRLAPLSPRIVIRVAQLFAATHPDEDAEQCVERATTLIRTLRSGGLDVVFGSWVDDPATAYGLHDDTLRS